MYSNVLIFIFIWFIKLTHQADLIVLRDDERPMKSNIVKRNVGSDIPIIKEFTVHTLVANRFAETNVLSKVENIDDYSKQTTFSVVLPERAFISGFFMEIGGQIYKAFVKEKEEAQKIYGQYVASGQTAAHVAVSTRNSNRFTVSVNVEPQSKVNFHLTYEELLQRQKGEYEIISNIQPGQIVKKLSVEVVIKESRPLLFVSTPLLRSGNGLLQNNPELDPHAQVKISNNSAVVKFYPDINRQLEFACAGLGNNEYDGFAGQFVVLYDIERDLQGGETLFQDGFFINFFAPPKLEPLAKHMVFVLDTSGSMEGIKITQLKEAMMIILSQLYPDDLLSIVQYEYDVHLWDLDLNSINVIPSNPNYGNLASHLEQIVVPEAIQATADNIETAKEIINQLEASGATNIIGGLEVGLYLIKLVQERYNSPYQPILVFLTDGLANGGIDDTTEIIKIVTRINSMEYKTPIYSICIGDDADWDFLRELSLATRAEPTRIYTNNVANPDVNSQLAEFYEKKISAPALNNMTFNNLPASAQFTQLNFPIFFNGSEITIAGKGVSGSNLKPIKVLARGKNGTLELEAKIGIPIVRLERIWAYLTVKQLLEASYATSIQSNKTEFQKLATDMALKYSLVTDVTSLVVVRPDYTNTVTNAVDAANGIFPESPSELPMCNNITNWILTNFGTPEPTTMEITTEMTTTTELITTTVESTTLTTTTEQITTTVKPTTLMTTTEQLTTTVEPTTTEEPTTTDTNVVAPESNFGISVPTILPTTEEVPVTQKILSCNKTPFGCCYDGVTPASGYNYTGCDPIPKFESCFLPEDTGFCSKTIMQKYSTKWAYKIDIGECQSFWYNGCGGNGNRFASKDICERICVNPKGNNKCKLPILLGNCTKYELSWFYDKQIDECTSFLYSGCHGNANRFQSKEKCYKTCLPHKNYKIQDACSLDKNQGTCTNHELQYYFDIKNGICRQFWFYGCGGNDNRFENEETCKQACINPNGTDICYLPQIKGPCRDSLDKWYFNKTENTCSQFTFSGCNGNKNNFDTRDDCEKTCASIVDMQEACFLKTKKGPCSQFSRKWAFSKKKGQCIQFLYGGCDGNDNKFSSKTSCESICINPPGKDRCKLPKNSGGCKEKLTRWYYDKMSKKCKTFIYKGCFGNSNNFSSLDECKNFCL